jgi:hypothetical protein
MNIPSQILFSLDSMKFKSGSFKIKCLSQHGIKEHSVCLSITLKRCIMFIHFATENELCSCYIITILFTVALTSNCSYKNSKLFSGRIRYFKIIYIHPHSYMKSTKITFKLFSILINQNFVAFRISCSRLHISNLNANFIGSA